MTTPDGRPHTRHPLWRCFCFYRQHIPLFLLVTVVIALVNVAMPLTQLVLGWALHDLDSGKAVVLRPGGGVDASRAWWWAGVLVTIAVVRGLIQYLSTVLGILLGQRLLSTLRMQLFNQIQTLDAAYHQIHGAGELITRTTRDSDKVRDAVSSGYRSLLEMTMIVLGSIGVLFYYHWLLGLVPVVLVLAAMVVGQRSARGLVALNRRADQAYDHVTQDLSEGVHGVRVIKAFGLEKHRITRFTGEVRTFAGAARAAIAYTAAKMPAAQLIVAVGHPWVLAYGAYLVVHGQLGRGELIAAMMAMQTVVFRAESIGRLVQTFTEAQASAERVVEVLDARSALADGSQEMPPAPLGLRFEGVSVRGRDGDLILDQLNLTLEPGVVVALVGRTGVGKSTLASLLPRLRDPDSGRVLLGSAGRWTDIRNLRIAELRHRVQVVFQDGFLFSDTLAANLRLAAPAATEPELFEALRQAAGEELGQLPEGLQSRIGERGVTLSGGQRQRVCLARTLLGRPAVLLLDDSTSALDALTEGRVMANLRKSAATTGTTVLLIASKLSSILLADRVAMLEDGKIAALGTHAELVLNNPAYRDLLGLDAEDAA